MADLERPLLQKEVSRRRSLSPAPDVPWAWQPNVARGPSIEESCNGTKRAGSPDSRRAKLARFPIHFLKPECTSGSAMDEEVDRNGIAWRPSSVPAKKKRHTSRDDLRRNAVFEEDIDNNEVHRHTRSSSPCGRPLLTQRANWRTRYTSIYTAFRGPASEALAYPQRPDCAHCGNILRDKEARYGTGLCDSCWEFSTKECCLCNAALPLKQLQWGSNLCVPCYRACDKECRMCKSSLSLGQLHWGTGLCDRCYNSSEKTCHVCKTTLERTQLFWGTGLCDPCYNSVPKSCRICSSQMDKKQLRWGSGLCDVCYDACEKFCGKCSSNIPLGSMHYRSGLCDTCYDMCDKNCKICSSRLEHVRLNSSSGLCDVCYKACEHTCKMCKASIGDSSLHWGTGLCDNCFNSCEKSCRMCQGGIGFGSLHWGSGLCDQCYASCAKQCKMCTTPLVLGQLHWGTRLCDNCFDSCEKICRSCHLRLDVGQLHWGTGLCDECYEEVTNQPTSLSRGVRAAIAAQFVFYAAPAILQPSLFIQIRYAGYLPDAPTCFAAILATASVVTMLAPVPLGMWAERRGVREVYVGIALAGTFAALLLAIAPPSAIFAFAWGLLNAPPAVRGVRAFFFAKHVAPQDLSRAGQLASTAGLAGGFLGPMASAACDRVFGAGGSWPDGFVVGAMLAAVLSGACAAVLRASLPRVRPPALERQNTQTAAFDSCERCEIRLTEKEKEYATALCDHCWDNYIGPSYSFGRFLKKVLFGFCSIAFLLEMSMNAGVIATFQPIVVSRFDWGNNSIAAVSVAGAGLSVLISLLMSHLRLPERLQIMLAAGLYFVGVVSFTAPPLQEWRLVMGLMLGIKAQILFMAPFTAIFSRLIGRVRLTNRLTTALCLAPLLGAASGTIVAPFVIASAGTWLCLLAALPAVVSLVIIGVCWRFMDGKPPPTTPQSTQSFQEHRTRNHSADGG